jgi:hypothetical protein
MDPKDQKLNLVECVCMFVGEDSLYPNGTISHLSCTYIIRTYKKTFSKYEMLFKTKNNDSCFVGCLISFNAINTSSCCLWTLVYCFVVVVVVICVVMMRV